jgi:hypothetical protein
MTVKDGRLVSSSPIIVYLFIQFSVIFTKESYYFLEFRLWLKENNFSTIKMADENGEDVEDGFEYADGIFLPPEERRGGPAPRYICTSNPKLGLKADREPEARLYCSMKAFIETSKINWSEESVNKIIDEIIKLGPKYVNYVNGPCLIIGYHLYKNSNNLREDMKKYVSTDTKTGIRTEKDIYRYVRFWRKMGI